MNDVYRRKVELLLRILPFVTDEECFAIHGGIAINLFVKNLNREESPYSMFFGFPSVKWKIQNLQKLKTTNPRKLQAEANKLRLIFGIE